MEITGESIRAKERKGGEWRKMHSSIKAIKKKKVIFDFKNKIFKKDEVHLKSVILQFNVSISAAGIEL